MKTKILSGLICCLGIFSANAQTITAPVGQSLTVTNPIDITVADQLMFQQMVRLTLVVPKFYNYKEQIFY